MQLRQASAGGAIITTIPHRPSDCRFSGLPLLRGDSGKPTRASPPKIPIVTRRPWFPIALPSAAC
eukprot:scaffold20452_cov150-Skeletonema_marinoi.AAC.15